MKHNYFYWGTTKKVATVFGAMFNDLHTGRVTEDGALVNVSSVPLSYGPRAKFLSRIRENKDHKISIKLPRMSYSIADFQQDTARNVSPTHRRKYEDGKSAFVSVPYELGFELDIYGRTLDDVLQILEQILPMFRPEYTISIKDIEGPGTTSDVGFKLASISSSDDYEGDFGPVRAIVYTLMFTANVKYLGPIDERGVIERVEATIRNFDTDAFWEKVVEKIDEPKSSISMIDPLDEYDIIVNESAGFFVGENIIGQTSGYGALIVQIVNSTTIRVKHVENTFILGEDMIGESSGSSQELIDILKVDDED